MMYFKTPFRGGNLENNFFKIKSKKTRFRSRKKLSSRERKKHALVHAYDQEKKYNFKKKRQCSRKKEDLTFFLDRCRVFLFFFYKFPLSLLRCEAISKDYFVRPIFCL